MGTSAGQDVTPPTAYVYTRFAPRWCTAHHTGSPTSADQTSESVAGTRLVSTGRGAGEWLRPCRPPARRMPSRCSCPAIPRPDVFPLTWYVEGEPMPRIHVPALAVLALATAACADSAVTGTAPDRTPV